MLIIRNNEERSKVRSKTIFRSSHNYGVVVAVGEGV